MIVVVLTRFIRSDATPRGDEPKDVALLGRTNSLNGRLVGNEFPSPQIKAVTPHGAQLAGFEDLCIWHPGPARWQQQLPGEGLFEVRVAKIHGSAAH